jgi:shikimate 5-dehydrogenase/shikimate kinase
MRVAQRAGQRVVIVGHRGVGKSSLLERIKTYRSGCDDAYFDLDSEIELRQRRTITEIFSTEGEEVFRSIEARVFREIEKETDAPRAKGNIYVACGGGFNPENIPRIWSVLWLRRATDGMIRNLSDRPTIDLKDRLEGRENAYRARADETLVIDEGLENPEWAERAYFLNEITALQGALTVFPENFRDANQTKDWLARRLNWGIQWFELRDDILSADQILEASRRLPRTKILVSFRDPKRIQTTRDFVLQHKSFFDWPLENGSCDFATPAFLSLHTRSENETMQEALARFPKSVSEETVFKAALPTANFDELLAAHEWCRGTNGMDARKRVFLPHSADGRWAWYRLATATHQDARNLNFFRESDGSSLDQPTLLQVIRRHRFALGNEPQKTFAAVIGDPVQHSRSPIEHEEFFAEKGISFYSIRVTESEFRNGALEALRTLGLRYVSVTAPLKELAFAASQNQSGSFRDLGSINTLFDDGGKWMAANTDLKGFEKAIAEVQTSGPFAVWGGGGTLAVIRTILPHAGFFSLRSRENRDPLGVCAIDYRPETVIWSVGRSRAGVNSPPEVWRPKIVIDLNYAEDSPGREYAMRIGAKYISGLAMFRAQGHEQRVFWSNMMAMEKKQ